MRPKTWTTQLYTWYVTCLTLHIYHSRTNLAVCLNCTISKLSLYCHCCCCFASGFIVYALFFFSYSVFAHAIVTLPSCSVGRVVSCHLWELVFGGGGAFIPKTQAPTVQPLMGNEFDAPASPTIGGWLAFSPHRGGAVCLQHHGLGQPYPWRAIWLTSDPGNFTEDLELGTGEANHIPPREKVKLQWRIAPPLTLRLLSPSSALPLKGRSSQIPALQWRFTLIFTSWSEVGSDRHEC